LSSSSPIRLRVWHIQRHTQRETLFCISFLTGKKIFVSKFTAYDGSDLLKSCWCYPWRLAQTNSAISWLCNNVSIRSRFNAYLAFSNATRVIIERRQ
jgi:hypothetical protein